MTDRHHNLAALEAWLASYDYHGLLSEDDVEKRFVLPLFQHLGYPDTHGHGKYTIHVNVEGRKGNPMVVDHIYFAEPHKQRDNQALVVIEAKRTSDAEFDKAIKQAQIYGDSLKPLLLVVTNGQRIVVLRRQQFPPDEKLFDLTIAELRTHYAEFYEQLNFPIVKRLRETAGDTLAYKQYIQLEQALRAHPDIQEILAAGDFTPRVVRDGRDMVVVQPKVTIEGKLPLGFDSGECTISFSHVLRRGLTIHLDHKTILGSLMTGIGTQPVWGARLFVEQQDPDSYLVTLGRTTTTLSAEETRDLCHCIDTFCEAYRAVMYQAEDALETWTFAVSSVNDAPGFYLVSVPSWLWDAMLRFSRKFDYSKGDTEWHIFEAFPGALRVSDRKLDHALVYGVSSLSDQLTMLVDYVHLVYVVPTWLLEWTADCAQKGWHEVIGKRGLWTAQDVHGWIEHSLVPKVRKHDCQGLLHLGQRSLTARNEMQTLTYIPPQEIQAAVQLEPYAADIQLWLTSYPIEYIGTKLLHTAYVACFDLMCHADPAQINLHYVVSNLGGVEGVEQMEYETFQYGKDIQRCKVVYQQALVRLQEYVNTLEDDEVTQSHIAAWRMRACATVLEEGHIVASQALLNAAVKVVVALWRQSRFEIRHVRPRIT